MRVEACPKLYPLIETIIETLTLAVLFLTLSHILQLDILIPAVRKMAVAHHWIMKWTLTPMERLIWTLMGTLKLTTRDRVREDYARLLSSSVAPTHQGI
jgi:hypothetical protein